MILGTGQCDDASVERSGDRLGDGVLEFALRPLDSDVLPINRDFDALGDRDRQSTDTRHASISPWLPDVGEDFPANAVLLGLPVGHQATGRRNDRHAEATEYSRQIVLLGVDTQTGLGDPTDAGDGTLPGGTVLQLQDEALAQPGLLRPPALDEPLLLEELGDVRLEF